MRDCENCHNYKKIEASDIYACSKWECDFEPIIENYVCGDCKYCQMSYDKQDWEIYSCRNEYGRDTDDPENVACKEFEIGGNYEIRS